MYEEAVSTFCWADYADSFVGAFTGSIITLAGVMITLFVQERRRKKTDNQFNDKDISALYFIFRDRINTILEWKEESENNSLVPSTSIIHENTIVFILNKIYGVFSLVSEEHVYEMLDFTFCLADVEESRKYCYTCSSDKYADALRNYKKKLNNAVKLINPNNEKGTRGMETVLDDVFTMIDFDSKEKFLKQYYYDK